MAKTYTKSEIAKMLRQVGFPESEIPTMTAITMAESGGRSDAFNPRGPDLSYGLAQINMYENLGPERRSQFGLKSNEELYDPITNLRAAKAIYDQQGLNAWGAYTNQSYKKFLPESAQAALDTADDTQPIPSYQPQETITTTPEPRMGDTYNFYNLGNEDKETKLSLAQQLTNKLLKDQISNSLKSSPSQNDTLLNLALKLDPVMQQMKTGQAGSGYANPLQILQNYLS
jgi:hypothetical protein